MSQYVKSNIFLSQIVLKLKKVSDEEFPTALRKALPLKSSAAIKELVDMFGAPDEASSILVRRSDVPPLLISNLNLPFMADTFDYKIIKIVNLQVKYELFFEEEPNGKQSKFVEKLEEQDQQEKMEYIRQIKGQFGFFFRPYFEAFDILRII